MKRSEENKGITLIALIITIIVMLILVGVTVSVVLNGGLFSKTRTAAEGTQIEIDRENLQSAVWATIGRDGKIHLDNIELPNGFTEDNGKYISLKGNKFRVKEDGKVELVVIRNSNELERYIFGEAGEGRVEEEISDFFEDESLDVSFLTVTLEKQTDSYILANIYIKFDNKVYKFKAIQDLNKDTVETLSAEGIELMYETKGREGETLQFDGDNDGTKENWKIIYDYGDNIVEIVSMDSTGTLVLGKDDLEAQGNTDIEKTIYSYNNVITRLNNYCTSLITNPSKLSVRSLGSNPENPNSENTKKYESNNLKRWNSAYNGVAKSGDINCEQDLIRMIYHDCDKIANIDGFVMASRMITESSEGVDFGMFYYRSDGQIFTDYMFYIDNSGQIVISSCSYEVRPVVKININSI